MKTKWFVMVVVLLALACSKKQDNPPPVGGMPYGGGPGIGVPGAGPLLATAYGKTYSGNVNVGMTFSTQAAQLPGAPVPTVNSYTGPVVATGGLRFVGAGTYSCPIIPGDYSINTIQPGNWNMSSFWNLRVEAVGPARLEISFLSNWILAAVPPIQGYNGQYPYKIQNAIVIDRVNGQPCPYPTGEYILE